MLLCRTVIPQRRIGDFKPALVKGATRTDPSLQVVGRVTRSKLNTVAVSLEAAIVVCYLDHSFVRVDEHDTKPLSFVIVAGSNIQFITTAGLGDFPMPATTCARLSPIV